MRGKSVRHLEPWPTNVAHISLPRFRAYRSLRSLFSFPPTFDVRQPQSSALLIVKAGSAEVCRTQYELRAQFAGDVKPVIDQRALTPSAAEFRYHCVVDETRDVVANKHRRDTGE